MQNIKKIGQVLFFWCLAFEVNAATFGPLPSNFTPCANVQSPFVLPSSPQVLPAFTALEINGDVNVDIQTSNISSITINGAECDSCAKASIHPKVDGDTLVIKADGSSIRRSIIVTTKFLNNLVVKNNSGIIRATDLNSQYFNTNIQSDGSVFLNGKIGLHQLDISGNPVVQIQGIKSYELTVHMQGNPVVNLTGEMNLKKLWAEGSGHLRMYWIDSDFLHVFLSGKVQAELAGVTRGMNIEVHDNAVFQGRYLRANKGWVKTTDSALAAVNILKQQSTLSMDVSAIEFYNEPVYENNFMAGSGAALNIDRVTTQANI